MEQPIFKVIELLDSPVDHSKEFPYTDQIPARPYLFILRTKKTQFWEPCLIFDYHEGFQSILPLSVGDHLTLDTISSNCKIIRGQFSKDGEWLCRVNHIPTGVINYQLVFTDYGSNQIKDLGEYDSLIVRQKNLNLRNLRKQTVFGRCIGDWKEWPSFLKKQIQLGYNAFHFAPIQRTGESKSYYSIFDQLELSDDIFSGKCEDKYQQLQKILKPFQKQGIIFFTDIVLNHTSFDSQWIPENPNAVFTLQNTPVLKSAYQLDHSLKVWGDKIKESFSDSEIEMDEDQFEQISQELKKLIQSLNLHEYFLISSQVKERFLSSVKTSPPSENIFAKDPSQIVEQFMQKNCSNLGHDRYGVKIFDLQQKWAKQSPSYQQEDLNLGIDNFNKKWTNKVLNQWVPQIINNILAQIKHGYLQNKFRSYKDPYPFINPYFSTTYCGSNLCIPVLNNGWVMDADTSQNMVTTKQFYYLRRKVNIWGDLIRIRYGQNPSQSPAWQRMKKYIRIMAKHFDGFRLDNLHGTPIHVAEYLIRQARKINPEIIIFAQLFTRSEQQTAMFTRRIGINSTLSELKHHLSGDGFIYLFHKVMRNSGQYTGSLSPYFFHDNKIIQYLQRQHPIKLIYDLTHDNNTYQSEEKTILKTPICVILELTGAFIGSTKGFDQFYTKKIDVTETRHLYLQDQSVPPRIQKSQMKRKIVYQCQKQDDNVEIFGSWNHWKQCVKLIKGKNKKRHVTLQLPQGKYQYKFRINGQQWKCDPLKQANSSGNHIIQFNSQQQKLLHADLEGLRKVSARYRKKYQIYRQYYAYQDGNIVFLMRQNKKHQDSIFIIANISKQSSTISHPIELPGIMTQCDVWQQSQFDIYGGVTTQVEITNHKNVLEYFDIHHDKNLKKDILIGAQLPPGFACFIACKKSQYIIETIKSIKQLKNQEIHIPPLGTLDYNIIMYGSDQEQANRFQIQNYVIPDQNKKLIFGGFGGILKQIEVAKRYNNLSIGIFNNLRNGDWLLDYYICRLKRIKTLKQVADIVERNFQCIKCLPAYLKPKYFSTFIYKFCNQLQKSVLNHRSPLLRKLILTSNQFFCGFQNTNPLFKVTLSAGLPHFCVGWARSWGRDTFTCNQMLLYHPNIYRNIILQYAATLRHGMIPNLLDFGNKPRYNCRDACWWFIRGICEYVQKTKDYSILKAKVDMIFLSNDILEHKQKSKRGEKKIMILQQIIHEIFQNHADGISYREWHAGFEIDQNMNTEGFNIKLLIDDQTGFIYGGNQYNCLTWMDKMGSSAKANNKGFPSTPRAGSPIQLVALLYKCLVSIVKLNSQGYYQKNSVKFEKRIVTFEKWAQTIKKSFEKQFYIPKQSQEKGIRYVQMYKDVVNSPQTTIYQSFRLRPNALIAMVVAPELFEVQHARSYLKTVQKHLINKNSIGISTLGSRHQTLYSSYYDNSQDSIDFKTAHGYSYHNGPEWVWLYGFYVAAKSIFSNSMKKQQLLALIQPHAKYINNNQWGSLPELTNLRGAYNKYSCQSQAWSISGIILALNQIQKYGK